jgi:hypothetical protein
MGSAHWRRLKGYARGILRLKGQPVDQFRDEDQREIIHTCFLVQRHLRDY